jgi:hypothetical protein
MFRLRMGSILRLTEETFNKEVSQGMKSRWLDILTTYLSFVLYIITQGTEICTQLFLHGRLTLTGLKECLAHDIDSKWKGRVTWDNTAGRRMVLMTYCLFRLEILLQNIHRNGKQTIHYCGTTRTQ